ncbi:MAG: GNAT family N-acetyltransferase [Roseibium sp.]|uniref:GNAT family N-acetyltransferase n=1 Tax=Roseibium sp. TaxID=1936156 RepID=UPI002609F41B|nr:GNAT family N-acetyltransferase [Roseibium sp.]MCV0427315.1 GNAT family N-acetyltransferase [Roseibium sp.]
MSQFFNRIVWSALTTRQDRFSLGTRLAKRFDPAVSPFAVSMDNSPSALDALADLIAPENDYALLLQAENILLPDKLVAEISTKGVLMTEEKPSPKGSGDVTIEILTDNDIPDMVALANLTKPGPFQHRTPELGTFWGVKLDGRLAAMAGTRLDLPGYTEVSGICTHPDFQGRGLATALSLHVATTIREKGDTPFLHAYADNHGAIALYRKLGFEIWSEVNVAKVRRCS